MSTMSPSSPISAYTANTQPGANHRTFGIIILLCSLCWAYCHWREVDLYRWIQCDARVFATTINRHSRRYSSLYDVDVQARYHANASDHLVSGNYARNVGYYEANRLADELKGKPIPIVYNPSDANSALLMREAETMHKLGPLALPLVALSALVGVILLVIGFTARQKSDDFVS
ncbi:MAG TPA: DUF3592 domain-containing protein [Oculatellaceae cyanobacterium]